MLHHVVAADDPRKGKYRAFERSDYLGSWYDRDSARHKAGSYQKSGHVECQSQLIRWSDYIEQSLERGTQVGDRLLWRCTATRVTGH
jgi:hypothetical protein